MCGKGSNTTTSNSSGSTVSALAPNPAVVQSYTNLLNTAQNDAATPYQAYGGQEVAPNNAAQTQGLNYTLNNAGFGLPVISSAGQPITGNDIQNYESPYTNDVVNATQADFNDQNARANSIVTGNAAAQGALGGDRVGVAQALTQQSQERAQAPVIAGLRNSGYQQAVSAAQADKSRQLQSGVAGENAAIQGGNAMTAQGTLFQQTQQAQDTQARQDYYQQQGYPFQTAQWLAGIEGSIGPKLGTVGASSTTDSGTTAGPTPNTWAQLAGLGLAGAGLFLKRGGRVNRAAGGYSGPWAGSENWVFDGKGWVPKANGDQSGIGSAPNATSTAPKAGSADTSVNNVVNQALGLASKYRNSYGTMGSPGISDPLMVIGGAGDYAVPTYMARGGSVRHGYEAGGSPSFADDGWYPRGGYGMASAPSFEDRAQPVEDAISSGVFDPQGSNYTDFAPAGDNSFPQGVPMPQPRPSGAPGPDDETDDGESGDALTALNKAAGVSSAAMPPSANAFDRNSPNAGFGAAPEKNFLGMNKVSPEVRNALIAAGLGMMATKRGGPGSFLGAAGEGGQAGLSAYSAAQKAQADRLLEQQKLQMQQEEHEAKMANEPVIKDAQGNTIVNPQYLKLKQKESEFSNKPPSGYRETKDGLEVIPGGPADPVNIEAQAEARGASLSEEDARAVAERYVRTGNRMEIAGFGRSARNQSKIAHYVNTVSKELNVSPEELATRTAEFEGHKASERTLGTMEARMGSAGFEAEGAIKLARESVSRVPRTSILPLNKLIEGYAHQSLNADQIELMQRLQAIKNTYAAVMARGSNVTTDAARARGDELLQSAYDAPALNRVFDVMESEINMARNSPEQMRQFYRQKFGPQAIAPTSTGTSGTSGATSGGGSAPTTKTLNGKTYVKRGDQWFEQ